MESEWAIGRCLGETKVKKKWVSRLFKMKTFLGVVRVKRYNFSHFSVVLFYYTGNEIVNLSIDSLFVNNVILSNFGDFCLFCYHFLFWRIALWNRMTKMILAQQLMMKGRKNFDRKRRRRNEGKSILVCLPWKKGWLVNKLWYCVDEGVKTNVCFYQLS